jgi:MoaE-MoaD fusion protein
MQVRVLLFAGLRERAGRDQVDLELQDGARARDVLDELRALTADSRVLLAVNQEYATSDVVLHPGDELALIPPVSGGAVAAFHTRVTDAPLSLDPLIERVRDPRAGAVVMFLGVTREVGELQYEAYTEMAERQLAEIVASAVERHGLCGAAAEHRIGRVPLSEPSVAVVVSAPHRGAAFAAAREIIDELKGRAPIWKKEEGKWIAEATPDTER